MREKRQFAVTPSDLLKGNPFLSLNLVQPERLLPAFHIRLQNRPSVDDFESTFSPGEGIAPLALGAAAPVDPKGGLPRASPSQ